MGRAMSSLDASSNAYKSMMPNIPANQKPGPTPGGAILSGAGGAMMGAQVGAMTAAEGAKGLAAVGGPWALGIGTGIGLLSYFLS